MVHKTSVTIFTTTRALFRQVLYKYSKISPSRYQILNGEELVEIRNCTVQL
jgi:hypothetical protein